ncbi:MAG: autotransporter outer membrane beta-barrel domain-containing protein [Methylococcaceae bacterium]|nr:autotransporter outer membrane beta-barrel domain-containing protein [Methylococcaceae bacterium]MDZ4157377.1 autotransporter outer membrane beta-barrel domain-containing protein [Methylococcales bacterium]MDP2392666.1 autotransporter outer membrane beta-barrel domain-containing protein [Methylococcaceae bacterium]MDP3021167.1 autotransporter outer membrane beta-barrel domain-containing protein [Methylococcaceae bacterium]MDP3390148.1 autotransporter outer membrane beta-barrel domain-contain
MFYDLKQNLAKLEINGSRLDFDRCLSAWGTARNLRFPLSAFGFLAATMSLQTASAQTFTNASSDNLQRICTAPPPRPVITGSQLNLICDQGGTAASSGVGTQSQPTSLLISQQLKKDAQTKQDRQDRPKSGSADAIAANWGNFSTFLTAGATTLRHRNNEFEQGYNATIPSVTVGGGYSITKSLEAGLAFNYSNSNANFNTGGGFNVDSYSPILYVNYQPFDNAFASLALGYTRQNQTNNRLAVAGTTNQPIIVSGLTTGKLSANQYTLNFLSGYDHPIDTFTIGPRVGVDVRQWEMNSYQESSNTGLELSYNNQYQTSIQSTLGLAASSAHRLKYGILVPQLSASWVHEYSNNSRTISSHFVQATNAAPSFQFQTENPAHDWAVINLGASFVMQRDVQVFANFLTVQGNRNFESYGGNLGVKFGW